MTFLMMIAVSALIGWYAQTKKGRIGAKWGAGTLALMIPTYLFLYLGTATARPDIFQQDAGWYAFAFLVVGGIGFLMGLAVASLPEKKTEA